VSNRQNERNGVKKMKNSLIGIFLIAFVFMLFSEASAQPRRERNEPGWRLKELNLTKEQEAKIDELMDTHRKEMSTLRDELDRLRIDKRAMVRDTKIQKDAYMSLEKKMSSLREKMSLMRAEHRMDIHGLLTDEQREQFQKGIDGRGGRGFRGDRDGARFRMNRMGFCR